MIKSVITTSAKTWSTTECDSILGHLGFYAFIYFEQLSLNGCILHLEILIQTGFIKPILVPILMCSCA